MLSSVYTAICIFRRWSCCVLCWGDCNWMPCIWCPTAPHHTWSLIPTTALPSPVAVPFFFNLNFLTLNRTLVLSYWLCNHPTSLYHIPQVAIDTMFCPLYLTNLSIYHVYTPYCPVSDPRQMGQALESWICSRFLPICISNSREFFLSPVTHGLSLNV